ncbi:MAG: CehA/McbA family metallohydrolase [bacterium]
MKTFGWRFCCLSAFVLAVACGDDKSTTPKPDAGDAAVADTGDLGVSDAQSDLADADTPVDPNNPGLELSPIQEGVSESGVAVETLEATGARIGRIASDDTGFHGLWAHCRNGDFRLYNERVELCIQAESTNRNEMFTGGSIVDLRLRGSDAEDVFDLLKPRVGFNVQFAERVYVVRDGTDGGPAVLRVDGYDTPVAYILGIVGGRLFKSDGLQWVTEYRLWPQSTEVEIVSWLTNPNMTAKNITPGEWLAPGDRTEVFRDQYGFAPSNLAYRWMASVGESSSITWYGEEDMAIDELPFSDNNPWLLAKFSALSLGAGQTHVWRRWLGIGDGTLASTQGARERRLLGAERALKAVRVHDAADNPVANRRVTILSKQGQPLYFGVTDINGEFEASWDEAATISVEPEAGFEATVQNIDGTASSASVTVPTAATLTVNATTSGLPTNVLVQVRASQPVPVNTEFVALGTGSLRIAPGTYTLQVTRGMEYDMIETQVVVTEAGATFDADMIRSVDTEGWIAADFHQHMEPSSDSAVNINDRITDNVCEGVEFVAPTDHDVVSDLQPYIDALGFTDVLNTFPGLEVSPRTGHVGVYPMPFDPSQRGNGTVALAYIDQSEVKYRAIPDIFVAARALPTDPVVQLNHPRGGTSLFDTTQFDPNVDDPRTFTKTDWSTDFDTIEVINRFPSTCNTFADLAQFLNVGLKKTGLGNSDTHTLNGNPAGTPRNYLAIDAQPGQIAGADVVAALKSGRVSVGAHAFIDFTDGKVPGDLIVGADQTFGVRVQTPSHSEITRLHVIVNGVVVQSLDRTGTNGNDFDEVIPLSFP